MATNPEATLSTANGIARHVQGDVRDLVPSRNLKFIKRIKYDKDNQVGADYIEPVWMTGEHGVTCTGSTGQATQLNGAEVAESKNATLNPSSMYFQSRAVIDLLARAIAKGDRAAQAYIGAMLKNTKKGLDKRREIKAIYGSTSVAKVSSATDAGTSSVITITDGSYASGIWLNSKNMPIAAYNGATLLNTHADFVVTSNNPKTKAVTVSGNADDIDALVAAGTSAELYLKTYKGNTGAGVKTIAKLVSGDSYLGISCASYPDVWCGTQKVWDSATQPDFTWDDLQSGVEEYVGRGGESDLIVEVPPSVWSSLNGALDALRVLDSSYKVSSVDMGHDVDAIKYHSLGVNLTIEMSTFVWPGEVLAFPDTSDDGTSMRRIGASDATANIPGKGEEMFNLLPNTNVCEWQMYCNEDIWTTRPSGLIYWGPSF